jgi:hypothetical protein
VFPNTPAVALQLRSGQNTSRGKRQWKAFPYKWLDHTFYSSGEDVPSGNKISSGNGANGRTGNETRQLSRQFSSRHVSRVSS